MRITCWWLETKYCLQWNVDMQYVQSLTNEHFTMILTDQKIYYKVNHGIEINFKKKINAMWIQSFGMKTSSCIQKYENELKLGKGHWIQVIFSHLNFFNDSCIVKECSQISIFHIWHQHQRHHASTDIFCNTYAYREPVWLLDTCWQNGS